ncbi:hypothetical protein [Lacticaseibacillus paracasei]|jgi:hypothetical protein|uniref:hypothetical protein n=1 Tax=Lacticaseibacillus paracasei TaxID=1597 RepID=UPI0025A298A8|nr:hypothetical protein [Lacticaseibacillus paracasei]MDM7528010.1 hypothetical protein [Lacticaseibacillus paracasei]
MSEAKKNTIGFFNKDKKHSADMAYKEAVPVKETYKGSGLKAFNPTAQPMNPHFPKKVKDDRGTIRIPKTQYYELLALLELSPNKYVYELIAELVDKAVQDMSKNRPEELRLYQQAIERIRATDQRKKAR